MKKILIIEDELDIAQLEQDYLELNGFEVDIATTGSEGFRRAMTNNYHLILLDYVARNQRIRSMPEATTTPPYPNSHGHGQRRRH